jgi:cyanate lyase
MPGAAFPAGTRLRPARRPPSHQAAALGRLLDLDDETVHALTLPPVRGAGAVDTTEPVVYRLQERSYRW